MYKYIKFEDGTVGLLQCNEVTEEGVVGNILIGWILIEVLGLTIKNIKNNKLKSEINNAMNKLSNTDKINIQNYFKQIKSIQDNIEKSFESKISKIVYDESKKFGLKCTSLEVRFDCNFIPQPNSKFDEKAFISFYKNLSNYFHNGDKSVINCKDGRSKTITTFLTIKDWYNNESEKIFDFPKSVCDRINSLKLEYSDDFVSVKLTSNFDEYESMPTGGYGDNDCEKYLCSDFTVKLNEKKFKDVFGPLVNLQK